MVIVCQKFLNVEQFIVLFLVFKHFLSLCFDLFLELLAKFLDVAINLLHDDFDKLVWAQGVVFVFIDQEIAMVNVAAVN